MYKWVGFSLKINLDPAVDPSFGVWADHDTGHLCFPSNVEATWGTGTLWKYERERQGVHWEFDISGALTYLLNISLSRAIFPRSMYCLAELFSYLPFPLFYHFILFFHVLLCCYFYEDGGGDWCTHPAFIVQSLGVICARVTGHYRAFQKYRVPILYCRV